MSDDFDLLDSSSFDVPPESSKYPFLNTLGLDLDVTRRLTLHLDRLKAGDSTVITSALGKSHDPYKVLDSWNSIFESKLSSMNQTLIDLEYSNKSKFGPRSISKPWSERISSIESYYDGKLGKLPFDLYSGLKNDARGRLRPLSIEAAVKQLKNSTNSGLPYYCDKGIIKDRLKQRMDYLLSRRDPCILFTRTQEGDKTRDVWGYPASDTTEEQRYYRPMLDFQSKLSWRSALIGPDEVSKAITNLILSARASDQLILSGDISKFDASVCFDLVRACFYYIKQLFQPDYRPGLDRILDRFSTIELLTPDGIVTGVHGVPSGSTFTNEVDSIVHFIILSSLGISSLNYQVQGDDFVVRLSEPKLPELKRRYSEARLIINDKKSYVSKDFAIYLQNLFHIDYMNDGVIGGIYPTYRALCRIMFQERWSRFEDYHLGGIDYYSIRTISILENCKHHPLFRDLVEFVYNLDKYSLRFSREAISKYDSYLGNSSGTGGFLYNQYGDNVKGINNFQTVKIIRELNGR